MTNFLLIIAFLTCVAMQGDRSLIRNHVAIKLYPYEQDGEIGVSAMPELRHDSELMDYKRRFEYLLINVPEIHQPEQADERNEIWGLYPDTVALKKLYLDRFARDEKLVDHFSSTYAPIADSSVAGAVVYTLDETLKVASRFFYCDKVMPDSSIQAHVCVGLNGIREADWDKDYTLLEAFCYAAIFRNLDKDSSKVWQSFIANKEKATSRFGSHITALDQYLTDVRAAVFEAMRNDPHLKRALLDHYEFNKTNLAFAIDY